MCAQSALHHAKHHHIHQIVMTIHPGFAIGFECARKEPACQALCNATCMRDVCHASCKAHFGMNNIANLSSAQLAACVQSHLASSSCQLLLGKGCGLMLSQLGACPDGAALLVALATADAAAAAAAVAAAVAAAAAASSGSSPVEG